MDPMGYWSNAITNASFKKCIFGVRIALINHLALSFTYSSILAEGMVKFYITCWKFPAYHIHAPNFCIKCKEYRRKEFFQKWDSQDIFYKIFSFKNNMVEWDKIVLMVFHRNRAELLLIWRKTLYNQSIMPNGFREFKEDQNIFKKATDEKNVIARGHLSQMTLKGSSYFL